MTKLLQQCFLFFIVVVILGHNLDVSQVSVYRTIGPSLVSISDIKGEICTFWICPCKVNNAYFGIVHFAEADPEFLERGYLQRQFISKFVLFLLDIS